MRPGSPFAELAERYRDGDPVRNFAEAAEMWASVVTPNPEMMEAFQYFVVIGLRITDYVQDCGAEERAAIGNAVLAVCQGMAEHVRRTIEAADTGAAE